MVNSIDLHIHTTASDGKDSPEQIIQKAEKLGLSLISITDHDCVASLGEIRGLTKETNIKCINGLELKVFYYTPFYCESQKPIELHILGYGFDLSNPTFLKNLREYRMWRIEEISRKVNEKLARQRKDLITPEECMILGESIEGAIIRPYIARLLIKKWIVENSYEAFKQYLIECDVPNKTLDFTECSQLIRNAGGRVVLAHPSGQRNSSLLKVSDSLEIHEKIISEMRPLIDGIECFYWDHNDEQTDAYVHMAKNLSLIITGGTDHHGGEKERIGQLDIPDYVREYFL